MRNKPENFNSVICLTSILSLLIGRISKTPKRFWNYGNFSIEDPVSKLLSACPLNRLSISLCLTRDGVLVHFSWDPSITNKTLECFVTYTHIKIGWGRYAFASLVGWGEKGFRQHNECPSIWCWMHRERERERKRFRSKIHTLSALPSLHTIRVGSNRRRRRRVVLNKKRNFSYPLNSFVLVIALVS